MLTFDIYPENNASERKRFKAETPFKAYLEFMKPSEPCVKKRVSIARKDFLNSRIYSHQKIHFYLNNGVIIHEV